jgi:hypothetical protein
MRIAIAVGHPEGPPRGEYETMMRGSSSRKLFGYRAPGWM